MKLVRVRRTGTPCFVFDNHVDRGFDVVTGGEVSLTELAATDVLRGDGWERVDAPVVSPVTNPQKKKKE